MASSTIKKDSGIIYTKDVDLQGTEITTASNGWYYTSVSLGLPQNATAIGFCVVNYDIDVVIMLNGRNSITLNSPTSKILGNNRSIKVYYAYI